MILTIAKAIAVIFAVCQGMTEIREALANDEPTNSTKGENNEISQNPEPKRLEEALLQNWFPDA